MAVMTLIQGGYRMRYVFTELLTYCVLEARPGVIQAPSRWLSLNGSGRLNIRSRSGSDARSPPDAAHL